MRIYPINNFYTLEKKSAGQTKQSGDFGFKSLQTSLYDKLLDSMVRSGNATFIETLLPNIKKYGAILGNKYQKYQFGDKLSASLFMQYALIKKIDYSDFVNKFRDCIINAGFVSFARDLGNNNDNENEISFANDYISNQLGNIINAAEILGEDTICYATTQKRKRFEKILYDTLDYKISTPAKQNNILLLKTNPKATIEYKDLEAKKIEITDSLRSNIFESFHETHQQNKIKIEELLTQIKLFKQNFSNEAKLKIKELYAKITEIRRQDILAKPEKFLYLEQQLSEIKGKQNKILKNGLTDPQRKIELFYLYKLLRSQNIENLVTLDSLVANSSKEDAENLKSHIKLGLQTYLKLSDKEIDFLYNSGIEESPYIYKILEANNSTVDNIKELIKLLANSNRNINDTLNNLEQNLLTKKVFEEHGYNYEAWAEFDETRDIIRINDKIVIKKVDMNDIKHSLFLGNQVGCCTAIGSGSRAEYAPRYIANKFIQAIELIVDNKPVANTMCYLIHSKTGRNALVLDNMEVLIPYNEEDKYLKMFLQFAEQLISNIGAPYLQILAGHRHKFKMAIAKPITPPEFSILGSSGNQEINIDSITQMNKGNCPVSPEKYFTTKMFYKF